ncbi:unnamed protein product [Eruca vesicaria subsp. sativa]|uniref:Ubiquitin-like protease family profile domain-containing protein n=1 Tax=Eruca vesicaria subsp. sativa TaxID=29727 RepID=A0ABC8LGC0_ERUVS|nr:unnamed protein product [Eruca vesicaria subsp. sativa]
MDLEDCHLPQHPSINSIDIRRVEFDPDLVVTPIIPIESQAQPGWGVWDDDDKDDSVIYLEQLIADEHSFNKQMWHGGVTSEPLIQEPKKRVRVKKKSPPIKQSLKPKQPSSSNQRRISSYFTRSSVHSFTNVQLTEIVIQLSMEIKQLRREMKRRKKRSHHRQSSFHYSMLPRRKKSKTTPHKPESTPPNTDGLHNQDGGMETDEFPQTCSPVISQYEAQLHRDATADPLLSDPCIQSQSVHVSPNHNNISVHISPDHKEGIHNLTVHRSPDHKEDSGHHSPVDPQTIHHPPPDTYSYDEPPLTPVSVQPPWSELKSAIYDQSDHPNSPEINHILYHGVRIYDAVNPDPPIFDSSIPPSSPQPIFDSSIPPSSPPRNCLILSPQPTTLLTSPTKSIDSLSGFAGHAATVNAFTATASSNTPPHKEQKTEGVEPNTDEVVDLTETKDMERHVLSLEEIHLSNELSRSPLIHAIALISPLPSLKWDLFCNTIKTRSNVYHTTLSEFEFSNKFLIDLAKPQQWTTSHHMEILIYMLAGRHSTHLLREKSAFTTPLLASYIYDSWSVFGPCRKRSTFVWDERLADIVLQEGKKWMHDIHTIYTPMLWNNNLDLGLVEILDPIPALYADTRVERFMQPLFVVILNPKKWVRPRPRLKLVVCGYAQARAATILITFLRLVR